MKSLRSTRRRPLLNDLDPSPSLPAPTPAAIPLPPSPTAAATTTTRGVPDRASLVSPPATPTRATTSTSTSSPDRPRGRATAPESKRTMLHPDTNMNQSSLADTETLSEHYPSFTSSNLAMVVDTLSPFNGTTPKSKPEPEIQIVPPTSSPARSPSIVELGVGGSSPLPEVIELSSVGDGDDVEAVLEGDVEGEGDAVDGAGPVDEEDEEDSEDDEDDGDEQVEHDTDPDPKTLRVLDLPNSSENNQAPDESALNGGFKIPNLPIRSPSTTPLTLPSLPQTSTSTLAPAPPLTQSTPTPTPSTPTPASASTTTQLETKPKPKSKAPRSPSPPPPQPTAPRLTIRLDFPLGGPDNYEVDIHARAKEMGQIPDSPVDGAEQEGGSGDESDGEDGKEKGEKEKEKEKGEKEDEDDMKPKSKRGRKTAAQEYYDLHDPFIDDSELEIDERKFMAQTKQKGFYVSAGEVQLLKDKSATGGGGWSSAGKNKSPGKLKPGSLTLSGVGGGPLNSSGGLGGGGGTGGGGREKSPLGHGFGMSGDEDYGHHLGVGTTKSKKRTAEESAGGGVNGFGENGGGSGTEARKRRKTESGFSVEVDVLIEDMKKRVAEESWDVKGKFPPTLKPYLTKMAIQALLNDEYDENFWALLPKLFPYNKFTMTKLTKRLVYTDHHSLLMKKQDEKLADLKKVAEDGFEKAKEDWERSVLLWEKRVQKQKEQDGLVVPDGGGGGSGEASEDMPPPPPPLSQAGGEDAMEVDGDHAKDAPHSTAKDAHPPPKRYRMNDPIRHLLWELVQLSNESVRITNEKNQYENNNEVLSEQGVRKTLYQRIVAAFPEGWMNSGIISREVSAYKKKLEKEEE